MSGITCTERKQVVEQDEEHNTEVSNDKGRESMHYGEQQMEKLVIPKGIKRILKVSVKKNFKGNKRTKFKYECTPKTMFKE